MANNKQAWELIAERKREDRANRLKPYSDWSLGDLSPPPSQRNVIPFVHARLTDRERSFLASDVTDLVHRLATRECTAVEVATAFCKATYAAQELTNCVTEVMFTQALDRARELDAHILKTGRTVGPLHGVPVSVKDHISVEGEDTAIGFVSRAGKNVAETDATIVQILRKAGAIIYVKTTNPQSVYALETSSNIYGYTTNPYNRDLSSGGSSGGEGALVGSRAGLLGVGTDIGGSIATFGMVLPSSGLVTAYQGKEDIVFSIGPMAHSVRDLELFLRVISAYEPWNTDFRTICMPWNHELATGRGDDKLVIGMFTDDGVVAPHPPIVERLRRTREALVAAGHEVIDWVPMEHMQALELLSKMYVPDGGEKMRSTLAESGEPAIVNIARILARAEKTGGCTLAQSWETNVQRDGFRARALKHWNKTALRSKSGRPVDAILCPAAATLACPPGTMRWGGYTMYWNLLDLPAAVFPVGELFDARAWRPETRSTVIQPRNPVEEFVANQWDPETYDGVPMALQLVGRRWQEEKLIATLKIVDNIISGFEKESRPFFRKANL
ncbi:hypothetical protein FRC11_013706 [Ceratobasidium sp. 423]|nr:hypothetical protein FRC11_013706 [Ceratobasidium sp. 423]